MLDSDDNFLHRKTNTYKRYGTKKAINITNNKFSLKKIKSMISLSNTTIKTKLRSAKFMTKKKVTEVKL